MHIIGITGPAGAGKDTAAAYLVKRLGRPWRVASFADPFKAMLREGLSLSEAQLYGDEKGVTDPRYGKTPRELLQTLGTQWGRDMVGRDVWVEAMAARIGPAGRVVIPDVRFENEADMVRRRRGRVLHIKGRGGIDGDHASEPGVELMRGDAVVWNGGTVSELYDRIDAVFDSLVSPCLPRAAGATWPANIPRS